MTGGVNNMIKVHKNRVGIYIFVFRQNFGFGFHMHFGFKFHWFLGFVFWPVGFVDFDLDGYEPFLLPLISPLFLP